MTTPLPTICILGPTASGKTALALALSERLNCEIISVDSSLVYRGMDIGTAKPSPNLLSLVPHHLIDICDVTEPYSAAQFQRQAKALIADIHARDRIPILVGGTMLYFRALLLGLSELPSADPLIREELINRLKTQTLATLHNELKQCDPVSAARIQPSDQQRILRALEVYLATRKPLSEHWRDNQPELLRVPGQLACFALSTNDRGRLHDQIAQRFQTMLTNGLVDEVKQFYVRPEVHANLPAMRSVGYRQVWSYLEGELTYTDMVEKAIITTRQLAKRQLTWLRRWPATLEVLPISMDEADSISRSINLVLNKVTN